MGAPMRSRGSEAMHVSWEYPDRFMVHAMQCYQACDRSTVHQYYIGLVYMM